MLDYKQLFEYLQVAVSFQLIFSCFIVEKKVALETEDIQEDVNEKSDILCIDSAAACIECANNWSEFRISEEDNPIMKI